MYVTFYYTHVKFPILSNNFSSSKGSINEFKGKVTSEADKSASIKRFDFMSQDAFIRLLVYICLSLEFYSPIHIHFNEGSQF